MGYCLPALVGVLKANKIQDNSVILVTGEGGIQMNLQELQTLKHNFKNAKIIVINNDGYHSIRITQKTYFKDQKHNGIGSDSGDISFPNLEKLALLYDFAFFRCTSNDFLKTKLKSFLENSQNSLLEVMVTKDQIVEPKLSSKRLKNGQMVSAPLEDLAPFLNTEEINENMFIPLFKKSG